MPQVEASLAHALGLPTRLRQVTRMDRLLLGNLSIIGPNKSDCAEYCDVWQLFGQKKTPDSKTRRNQEIQKTDAYNCPDVAVPACEALLT